MTTDTMTVDETQPTEAPDLRARMRTAMMDHGLSQSAAAARVGMSAAALNQWLGGKYKGDNSSFEAKVARFLDGGLEASAALPRVVAPDFQATQTAQRIIGMLTAAQYGPDIVVIAGVPGVGKTRTVRHYQTQHNQVWLATMDPTIRSPNAVMTEIANVMGVPPGSPQTLRERLGERMRGSVGLLAVDEAQHLSGPTGRQSLDLLRSLHDRYGIGLALIGNHGVYAGVAAVSRQDGFSQFFSRVGARRRFEEPTADDIAVMLDAWGIDGPEERKFLTMVASKMWALRGLEKTIRAAMQAASNPGEAMTLRHLKMAWASLNHFEAA